MTIASVFEVDFRIRSCKWVPKITLRSSLKRLDCGGLLYASYLTKEGLVGHIVAISAIEGRAMQEPRKALARALEQNDCKSSMDQDFMSCS